MRVLLAVAAAGCSGPALGTASAPQPVACASTSVPGVAARAIAVAPAAAGATLAWTDDAGVARVDLDGDAQPTGPIETVWPGAYDRVTAAAIADRVVLAASSGDTTAVVAAPFGVGAYRELAQLGGIAGASPIVTAGGARLAPSVWYGGLLVAWFDDAWVAHTARLAVLGPAATEVAATAVGDEAVIAWPAGDACFVELALDAGTGTGWQEAGACRAPRLAAVGGGVALAFERDDGVYLALAATPEGLHPAAATLVASGAHAPRLVAHDGAYWLSYLAGDGTATVARIGGDGALFALALAPATAHELAVFGGAPRELAVDAGGLTATALCAE